MPIILLMIMPIIWYCVFYDYANYYAYDYAYYIIMPIILLCLLYYHAYYMIMHIKLLCL